MPTRRVVLPDQGPASRRGDLSMVKAILGFAAVFAGVLALSGLAAEQRDAQQNPDAYAREVRPILAKHCFSCHGDKKAKAKLNLESFSDKQDATSYKVWKHVWDRVLSRQMPPPEKQQ